MIRIKPNRTQQATRTTEERFVEAVMGLTPVAYYRLNDAGAVAANSVFPGNQPGSITGALVSQSGATGLGNGMTFDGVDDIITVTDTTGSALDLTTTISGLAVFYATGWGESSSGRFFDKGYNSAYLWALRNGSSEASMQLNVSGTTLHAATSSIITLNAWHLVGFSYDRLAGSNQVKFYRYRAGITGGAVGVATSTGTIPTNNTSLFIGNDPAGARTFDGKLQHIAIFPDVVTEAEFTNLATIAGLAT